MAPSSVRDVISDLVLDATDFGTYVDQATAFALLDRFVAAGGTTIDTSNCGSPTGIPDIESEASIGAWLWLNPGIRERLRFSTAITADPPASESGASGNSSSGALEGSVRRSCDRFGVDYLDLCWVGRENRVFTIESTTEAMGALVSGGTVHRLGLANHPTWLLERARAYAARNGLQPFTAVQLATSYIAARPGTSEGNEHRFGLLTAETLDYATVHPEVEIWAYNPLLGGAYDENPIPRSYQHSGTSDRLAALSDLAGRHGVSRSQLVLSWLLHGEPRIRPMVRVNSTAQLDSMLTAATIRLDNEELRRLNEPA